GFGKPPRASLTLLRRLAELRALQLPLVVGPSRKGFIGHVLGPDEQHGWEGTAAAVALAIAGGADIVRVHDVARLARVVRMAEAEPWLEIPHPEMWRRLFVLVPLRDLRPDLRAPDGTPIAARIAALEAATDDAVRPYAE